MSYPFFSPKIYRGILIAILIFNALSAFGGGIGLVFFNGLGMPVESLHNIFPSFLIPGLILLFIVGGTNFAAAILIIRNWKYSMESVMVAGFGMQIWIYTELYIIRQPHWLQTLYFATGILVLIIAFLLHGRLKNN